MVKALPAKYGLALMRGGFGLYFLVQAYGKTREGWLSDGAPLARMLRQSLPHAEPWYQQFLQGTVLPHVSLFAQLVTLGEWAAGISLFLGLLTHLGALTAIWLNANYMLMKGLPNVSGSVDRLFILSGLVFLVTSAGLAWGLDGVVWRGLRGSHQERRRLAPSQPYPTGRHVGRQS